MEALATRALLQSGQTSVNMRRTKRLLSEKPIRFFSPNFSRTSFCGSSNDYILFTPFINADNESYTRLWDRILDQEKVEEEPRDVSTS